MIDLSSIDSASGTVIAVGRVKAVYGVAELEKMILGEAVSSEEQLIEALKDITFSKSTYVYLLAENPRGDVTKLVKCPDEGIEIGDVCTIVGRVTKLNEVINCVEGSATKVEGSGSGWG